MYNKKMQEDRKAFQGRKEPTGILQNQEKFLRAMTDMSVKRGLLSRIFSILQSIIFQIFGLVLIFLTVGVVGDKAWHQLLVPSVIGLLILGVGIRIFWNNTFRK